MPADSSTKPKSFVRRHPWLVGLGLSAFAGLAALVVVAAVLARRAEPFLRAQIVQALSSRLHARVELDSFHVRVGAGLHGRWGVVAEGRGLRIWPAGGQPSATPLIQLDEFHFHAPLRYQSGKPIVISLVQLSGLSIHVPPKSQRQHALAQPMQENSAASGVLARLVVERIECDRALLILETDKPNKLPMGFDIQQLHLTYITPGQPMSFEAQLTNPRPVGLIHATGNFGPWQADDPGASPVAGTYTFDHADLGPFKGIAGILNSAGSFQGTLRDLAVDGDADVPNFSLDKFGSPMPLHTHFHARVDGTDGDTWLDRVDATLGSSHFTTQGRIVRFKTLLAEDGLTPSSPEVLEASPFEGGHDILLDIDIEKQPIDDFMRLVNVQEKPLLTGILTVKARLHIPPGADPVEQKLTLDGAFQLEQAQFTSQKISSKVDELSLRAQGKPKEVKKSQSSQIESRMQSNFHVANAVVTLPDLDYTVPGADIQLHGTYGLEGGTLNFQGNARMDATVSQMVGGWKGLLLKPADHFFKKDGAGAFFPLHVAGTRDAPSFHVDLGHQKGGATHPENPAHPDHPQPPDQPTSPSDPQAPPSPPHR